MENNVINFLEYKYGRQYYTAPENQGPAPVEDADPFITSIRRQDETIKEMVARCLAAEGYDASAITLAFPTWRR